MSSNNESQKMSALVLHEVADLRLDKVEIPTLKENTVLLKIKNCGICSSDLERVFINGTYHFPTIPGHEFAGEIVDVYNENDKNLIGKKASVFPLLPCFKCDACRIEEYAQCSNYNYFGSRCDGGFSEYLVVPKWNLVFFENLDFKVAALCEPAAVAVHAIKLANLSKDKKILVMGSGTIGLLIALFLKSNNYNVYISSRNKKSMEFINSLGLTVFDINNFENELNKKTNNNGFDIIYEAVGSNESITNSIKSSSNFAQIVLIGNPKENLNIEKNIYWKVLRKQINLIGSWNSSYNDKKNDWQEAIKYLENNQELYRKLITKIYSLPEYNKAFSLLKDSNEFKIKIMFQND